MTDQPDNFRAGANIAKAWWFPITIIFAISAAWFSLQGRVSAVEQANSRLNENIGYIREDVQWLRNNVITK